MKRDFMMTMATGRQNAMGRRNRGHAAGAHSSWTFRRSDYAPADLDSHAVLISAMGERWRDARIDALEGFLRAAFPERYEVFE